MNIKSDFFTNLLKCCSPPPSLIYRYILPCFRQFTRRYLSLSLSFSVALILSPSSSSLIRNDSLSLSRFELNVFFCVLGGIQDDVSLSLPLSRFMLNVFCVSGGIQDDAFNQKARRREYAGKNDKEIIRKNGR